MRSREPARIALFVANLGGGGAQRRMVVLADAFARAGHRVDLVVAEPGGVLDEINPSVGVRVLCAQRSMRRKRWRMLAAVGPLARYLEAERPDALMSTSDSVNVAALLAAREARVGTRVVVRIDNPLKRSEAAVWTLSHHRRMWRVKRLYPTADRIVAISQGLGDEVLALGVCAPERLAVIHNPVLDPFLEARAKKAPGHPWLEDRGPPVVLAAGRLVAQKDFATLLRAFALLREQREARLLLLGEGPERSRLFRQAQRLGINADFALPGLHPNPVAAMARAGVFVSSSAWEGFGTVLVEALAAGCPIVSTDCPSGPGEILEDGKYGALVPVGDASQMARAIAAKLDRPGDAGPRLRRAKDFRVDEIADRYLSVLLDAPG